MKILHLFSYPWYTGPAEPMLRLARAQQRDGHEVAVAFDTWREGDMAERAGQFGVPHLRQLRLSVKAGAWGQLRDWRRLRHLLYHGGYQVVHCHRSHDHVLATLARGRRRREPLLVRTLHRPPATNPARAWLLARTDGVLTPCRRHRELLLERRWLTPERVAVIEGIVDFSELELPPGDLRRELDLPPAVPVAGTAARMKPGRGLRLLLGAWRQVAVRLPQARLLLAGRGELEPQLRRLVEGEENLRRTVLFVGYRRDLGRFYRTLDIMILLAPGNDGTCRAALQAMACGRPLVASARDTLAEIVDPGRTGFLVAPADGPALSRVLIDALEHRQKLPAMGQEAARQARQRFTAERQLRVVMEFYSRLRGRLPATA